LFDGVGALNMVVYLPKQLGQVKERESLRHAVIQNLCRSFAEADPQTRAGLQTPRCMPGDGLSEGNGELLRRQGQTSQKFGQNFSEVWTHLLRRSDQTSENPGKVQKLQENDQTTNFSEVWTQLLRSLDTTSEKFGHAF